MQSHPHLPWAPTQLRRTPTALDHLVSCSKQRHPATSSLESRNGGGGGCGGAAGGARGVEGGVLHCQDCEATGRRPHQKRWPLPSTR